MRLDGLTVGANDIAMADFYAAWQISHHMLVERLRRSAKAVDRLIADLYGDWGVVY